MRLLRAATAVAFALALATVAPSVSATDGLHVQPGIEADEFGCYSLQVWNGDQLFYIVPPKFGGPGGSCFTNSRSTILPNGNLLFDWSGYDVSVNSDVSYLTEVWGSDGTGDGTTRLAHLFDSGTWQQIGAYAVIWNQQDRLVYPGTRYRSTSLSVTSGTVASTFSLPGELPDAGPFHPDNGPLYAVVGDRIVYAAKSLAQGRELYVSDGTPDGSFLLKDIRPGRKSSKIKNLVSDGATATFKATTNGRRAKLWVTDGTVEGTHKAP